MAPRTAGGGPPAPPAAAPGGEGGSPRREPPGGGARAGAAPTVRAGPHPPRPPPPPPRRAHRRVGPDIEPGLVDVAVQPDAGRREGQTVGRDASEPVRQAGVAVVVAYHAPFTAARGRNTSEPSSLRLTICSANSWNRSS